MPETCSIPYCTTSVFSSTRNVTDLVLIYGSVTSSFFVVRWLTLHSWTLYHDYSLTSLLRITYDAFSFTNDFRINYMSFYTSLRTEYRTLPRTVLLLLRLFVVAGTCLPNRCLAMDYSASILCCVSVFNSVATAHYLANCVSTSRFLATDIYSNFTIPAFSRHITIFIMILSVLCTKCIKVAHKTNISQAVFTLHIRKFLKI
jgi:hypothetical protein